MGAARQQRGDSAISRTINAEAVARRNTRENRTRLWAELIEDGHVLTWEHPRGGIMSLGPYQTAVPGSFGWYAVLSRHGDQFFQNAWIAALVATSFVGRQLPREAE